MKIYALRARLRAYLGFVLILFVCAFAGSTIAIASTGERGYGGLGMFIALPVAQGLFEFLCVRQSLLTGLACVSMVSLLAYFGALAAVEVYQVRLVHDFYGVFDFLVVYTLISLAFWESINLLARVWQRRAQ